jgi:hypothetical protein
MRLCLRKSHLLVSETKDHQAKSRSTVLEARCFGCGQCDGTHGYTIIFPDGKQGFMYGRRGFDLPSFRAENILDVKKALQRRKNFS